MPDFAAATIEIKQASDAWGPFKFNFPAASSQAGSDGSLPYGSTIASAEIKAYIGNVCPGKLLSSYTELPNLIDPDKPPEVLANSINVYFQYPGDTYIGNCASIVFALTLSTGAIHSFIFTSVTIC